VGKLVLVSGVVDRCIYRVFSALALSLFSHLCLQVRRDILLSFSLKRVIRNVFSIVHTTILLLPYLHW